jgi:hypothetical protein
MRLFFFTLLFCSVMAHAHQTSLSSSGNSVRWPMLSIPLSITGSTSDISSVDQQNIILDSINQWNGVSPAHINVTSGALSTLTFTSDFDQYGSGVVGITEVSYNSGGQIQRANVLLNDNYNFRNTPGMYGSTDIYLGDVVSHELGHFLGQAHSEVLDSTMFYSSFSGQSTLHSDDIAAVRGKYSSSYGSIAGYVKGGGNIGVLGVHVQAISRTSGEIVSTFSDENGRFVISGLNLNDSYYLYTSPMKNSASLPAYFANVTDTFCPGSFVGSFFNACGKANEGFPQTITLDSSNKNRDVGTVTINCSLKANSDYNFQKLQPTFSPVTIYDFDGEDLYEKAFVGHFQSTSSFVWSNWDKLVVDLGNYDASIGDPKYLKVSLTGRKLGNQLEYDIEVWKNGAPLAQTFYVRQDNNLYAFSSGVVTSLPLTETYDTDLEAMIPLSNVVGDNTYEIRVRGRKLNTFYVSQMFPEYETYSNSKVWPYLLMASIWESPMPGEYGPLFNTTSHLSDNASCLDAPFTYKLSKAASPSRDNNSDSQKGPGPSCGTIDPPSNSGGGGGPMLWALGFMLTILASELLKRSKKFLS